MAVWHIGETRLTINKQEFIGLLHENPVIAAVKNDEGLEKALHSDCKVIFALYGNVMSVAGIARQAKDAGKACMLHLDLIEGLALREVSVDYIAQNTCADGILTTKAGLVKRAAACKLLAVQRFFLLDSLALENIQKQYQKDMACAFELLPGLMPKIIKRITATVDEPIIAGGLISEKEDVVNALAAGACAVSSTNPDIWFM